MNKINPRKNIDPSEFSSVDSCGKVGPAMHVRESF